MFSPLIQFGQPFHKTKTLLASKGRLSSFNSLILLLVAGAGFFLACGTYQKFLADHRQLWTLGSHDRNCHYQFGQSLALDLRHGDLLGLVKHIHSAARAWPPLHAILVGCVQAIGGLDYRLAVLPSLSAWMAALLFAFLIARRLVPGDGNLAGLVAVLFLAASPAHRAFATDVMLESLGACLTLAVLYFYLAASQDRTVWPARGLGFTLTALFLTKYNFWTLIVAGLGLGTLAANWEMIRAWLRAARMRLDWPSWLRAQLRHPLNYFLVAAAGVTGSLLLAVNINKGPVRLDVGGHGIEVYRTSIPALVTMILLLLRLLPWWWRVGHAEVCRLAPPARQLVLWHIYPLVVWFLWPQRLGYFLWYVTFTNHGGGKSSPVLGHLTYYWACLTQDYHAGFGWLLLALGLLALAVVLRRRLRPGGLAILVFILVAALLTNYHSACRSRFLHSWIASVWVLAGVGLALGCSVLAIRWHRWASVCGIAAAVSLVVALAPHTLKDGHAQEGGLRRNQVSMMALADVCLPRLADSRRPTLMSNGYLGGFLGWTYAERYGRQQVTFDPSWTRDADPGAFDRWLASTTADAILYLHVTPHTSFDRPFGPDCAERIWQRMQAQQIFERTEFWEFPQYGSCSVTLWKRRQ